MNQTMTEEAQQLSELQSFRRIMPLITESSNKEEEQPKRSQRRQALMQLLQENGNRHKKNSHERSTREEKKKMQGRKRKLEAELLEEKVRRQNLAWQMQEKGEEQVSKASDGGDACDDVAKEKYIYTELRKARKDMQAMFPQIAEMLTSRGEVGAMVKQILQENPTVPSVGEIIQMYGRNTIVDQAIRHLSHLGLLNGQ